MTSSRSFDNRSLVRFPELIFPWYLTAVMSVVQALKFWCSVLSDDDFVSFSHLLRHLSKCPR
jgi:hypothetical protein